MDEFLTFAAVALLVIALISMMDVIRYVKAKDWNGALTILLCAAGGIGLAFLAANADATSKLVLVKDAGPLSAYDGWSLVLLGIALGFVAPQVVQFRKALDHSDSAVTPPLVGPQAPAGME